MNTEDIINFLFPIFPREVGRYRKKVSSYVEMKKMIDRMNGLTDVYVSLYDLGFTVDKLWFEIDAPSIEKALDSAKKVRNRLEDLGYPYIVVFSGHRGFHFYIPVKFWKPPNRETGDVVIKDIVKSIIKGIKYVDRINNHAQLVRVPGTIHPKTKAYCKVVSLSNWSIDYVKSSEIDCNITLERIDLMKIYDVAYVSMTYDYDYKAPDFGRAVVPGNVKKFLQNLIRPCVYEVIIGDPEPPHDIRTDFVAELMWLGYSENDIVEIISQLGWVDYNERDNHCIV